MKKSIAATALVAGVVAGAGVGLAAPGLALAADSTTTTTSSATDRAAARLSAIKDALKGLVTDGTITQAQADKVATTLSKADVPFGGRHGRGPGLLSPEATAAAIGITVDELRTATMSGKTLTQIAAAEGMSKATLVSKLVTAAKTQLAADLKAGKITQAQYDAVLTDLQARITERVDKVGGPGHHGPGGPDGPAPSSTAPSTAATPSATA